MGKKNHHRTTMAKGRRRRRTRRRRRMPRRKRRRTRRSSKKNRNSKWVVRYTGPTFLPQAYHCKMVYTDRLTKTTGAANTILFQYNILDIANVDPLIAGSGVNGLDTMNSLFEKWRVNFAVFKMRIWNTEVNEAYQVTLRPVPNNNASISIEQERQNPHVKYRVVNTQNSGGGMVHFKSVVKPGSLSRRNLKYDDDLVTNGAGDTGPIEEFVWNVRVNNVEQNASVNFVVMVHITYYVKFYERTDQEPS